MRLRLKEDPREWRKFALATAVVLPGLLVFLWSRRLIPDLALQLPLAFAAAALAIGLARPRVFRWPYRAAMTVSQAIGQAVGRVLLVLIFLGLLIPMAWILRLLGKDLLHLKRHPGRSSYWQPARADNRFDRAF